MRKGSKSLKQWCEEHEEFGNKLLSECTGIDEEGNKHDINDIPYGSPVRMLWRCSKGHEWYASINHRTYSRKNCPHCAKINRSKNSFYTWCQNNGEIGKQFLSECTGIDEEGNKHDIHDIQYSSHTKMLWRCSKGHEWYVSIGSRTNSLTKCPHCIANSTSYPEQFIYWVFKQIYTKAISRLEHVGYEYDVAIPEIHTCIEYSPTHWHKYKFDKDQAKAEHCKAHNVNFIYIMEDTDNQYEETWTPNYICFHMPTNYDKKKQTCIKLVDYLLSLFNHSISEINIDLAEKNALEYSKGKIEYEKSIAYLYPDLAKEWHPTLNSIKSDEITKSSGKEIYWQCPNCVYGSQGEWQATPNQRVSCKTGCPCCGYNYTDGKCHKPAIKIASKNNNLKKDLPELAKEWHPTLNNSIQPDEITKGSGKEIYWQCPNCAYGSKGEWKVPPHQRVGHKTGCVRCNYSWYRAMIGEAQKLRKGYINKATKP